MLNMNMRIVEYPGCEEEFQMFVQKRLVLLVTAAEVLEELVSQPHELVHAIVALLVERDLEQVEHHRVDAHVAQQPLFVLPRFGVTERIQYGSLTNTTQIQLLNVNIQRFSN